MLVCIKGMKIPVSNLGGHTEVFWDAQDQCMISVNQIGGIPAGEHTLRMDMMRHAVG